MADGIDLDAIRNGGATPSLAAFVAAYNENDNIWWMVECGHHQNLFEEAVAEVERLRADNERLAQVAQSDRETARSYADEIVWSHAERDAALADNEALRRRLAPSQGEGYDNEVERLRAVIRMIGDPVAAIRAERDAALARIRAAEQRCEQAVEENRPPNAVNSEVVWLAGDIRAALAAATEVTHARWVDTKRRRAAKDSDQ